MTLKRLIFLAAAAYILVVGGGLLLYRIFIAYPELANVTIDSHKGDIRAINSTYLDELAHLQFFNSDWAKWDETFDFVAGKNPSYLQRNINSDSFISSNVDVVAIYNAKQENILTVKKDGEAFAVIKDLSELTTDINLENVLNQDEICAMIRMHERIGYFCSNNIQDSEERQAPNGTLIFIRVIDENIIKRLQNLTHSKISLNVYSDDQEHPVLEPNLDNINLNDGHYDFQLLNNQKEPIGVFEIQYKTNKLPQLIDQTTIISVLILLMLPILITIFVYFFFLKPMTQIFDNIGTMNKTGKLQNISIHTHIKEIDIFTANFNLFIQQIRQYQQKLESESNTDGLTNLFNRRYFDHQYDEMWRSVSRTGNSICVVMMDIDFFKKYNDHYGHQKGDDALKAVASKLKTISRRANETLARYGGEEFVLIIESLSHTELNEVLEKIIKSIEDLKIEHKLSDIGKHLTISCGACYIEKSGSWMKDEKEHALKTADDALYEAKKSGRNKYIVHPLSKS
jgi:diguanylate cyclase (GGDEF)-like protein